ncbi:MAG: hypothetical protein A2Z20_11890 [Bdellovibrionales bacterium RBG_16_40_8]|nr:MAG: hypothetical protein A2Z20_11890 [Bdellovibrionales bacterium RBG_16_40_8]
MIWGEIEAEERREATKKISLLKLIPLDVDEAREKSSVQNISLKNFANNFINFFNRVKTEDLMFFFQQLQTIYATGIPLLHGLSLIQSQCENRHLAEALKQIIASVSQGKALSEGMKDFPDLFDTVTVNLIRAGETSGQLEEIIDRVSKLLQQRLEQKAKIKSATFYPKIVLGMIVIVFCIVVYFVIPKFQDFFMKFGAELPFVTRAMLAVSNFMVGYWYLILLSIAGVIFGFKKFVANPQGRRIWDSFLLKSPVFGIIFMQNDLLSFCCILEMLIRSGIQITMALPIVKGALANTILQEDIETARKSVESGRSLRDGLDAGKKIPKMVTHLIGIGEEAGSLEKTLNRMSAFYRIQLEYKLNNLSKAIEPILLIAVFGIVLFLALGVFLPMWKMNSLIKR